MNYKIALLHGDGIGSDIINAAKTVLVSVSKKFNINFSFYEGLIGGVAIDKTGFPLPEETNEIIRDGLDLLVVGFAEEYILGKAGKCKKTEKMLLLIPKCIQ